ncbi:MAG: lipopolysaccharide biosynthesis protein, partial [Muribaculaceae bacterium]|nr:lipopolysaccharide biosynthesis protein [Muribaculaceae bacterium]
MPEAASVKNKRIAKNTLLLYVRTFFTMCVSLFTSRLTLEALGVDNFGIYNVVGGLVGMFSIISGSITGSISRYLTYGIGKGDIEKLKVLFSTSVNVLLILSGIIILLGETIGIWFLTHKLNIPENQMYAAHWVLQCSLLAFVLGLISIPYNAAIVAHEKMNVFAYMTILDVLFRLGIVYTLFVTPFDRLITYSVFLVCVGLIMRLIYGIYCTRHFAECHYERVFDKGIFKDMSSFAGWTFLGNTSYLLNTQGVNMIINVFFGVALNAARGIVTQVEGAVMTLVNNFTTAFTPQITKSYAEGNMSYVHSLVCRGTKFSIFLLLFIIVPLIIEAPVVLSLWLKEVPPYTATFLRLSLCCNALLLMGNASLTAI